MARRLHSIRRGSAPNAGEGGRFSDRTLCVPASGEWPRFSRTTRFAGARFCRRFRVEDMASFSIAIEEEDEGKYTNLVRAYSGFSPRTHRLRRTDLSGCRSRILMQPSEDRHDEGRERLGVPQSRRVPPVAGEFVIFAPKTMIWIVLPLIAASPTLHGHEGSAATPPPSTDNNRQAPRTGWREGSRRRQSAHETAAPGHQSLSATRA